jgi:peptidoglycan/xylan/chitin deacetylase (PgdA/CDA1 family)
MVPGWARALVASAIGRWNRGRAHRWAAFPDWPLDLSADALDDVRANGAAPLHQAPVVVTHDIDSAEGLANLVDRFLPLEESLGVRSTNYIVPCAGPIDEGRLREVIARGHELGIHGYDHGNRTPFAAPAERARRLDAGRAVADRFGATGYRAPSLLRTRALLQDVGRRFQYDSSIPTSGGLFPVPNNGCASARPFVVEGTTELPVSLPRDGTLRFLGYSPDQILDLWIDCADRIARARGVVVLLTHCEHRFSGARAMLDAYRRFLEHVRAHPDRFTFSSPAGALAGFR